MIWMHPYDFLMIYHKHLFSEIVFTMKPPYDIHKDTPKS
jgi:hypothetical protein